MAGADTYKPLTFFRAHTEEINTGFVPFSVGDVHYFAYYFGRKLVLISQGYKSLPGRDNGIESVKTNMRIKTRYKFKQDPVSKKYYFDLIAGNYQGVARSAWFKSEIVARAMANILVDEMGASPEDLPAYHPETFFEARINGVKNGFDKFQAEDGYYFTFNQDGKIILISTAKTTALERDEAVDTVRVHMRHEEWYEYRTIDAYQHDFRIVDLDENEIARSVVFGSEEAADQASLNLQEKPKPAVSPVQTDRISAPVQAALTDSENVLDLDDRPPDDVRQPLVERIFKWAVIALFFGCLAWTVLAEGQNLSSNTPLREAGFRCLNGSLVENVSLCPEAGQEEPIQVAGPEIICWDQSRVSDQAACPPEEFTLSPTITPEPETAYLCGDGRVVKTTAECPSPE